MARRACGAPGEGVGAAKPPSPGRFAADLSPAGRGGGRVARGRLAAALLIAALLPVAAAGGLKDAVSRADGALSELAVSSVVLDRKGALLRPFSLSDGRWRLATEIPDVDPAYVAMLIAYEDRRFRDHRGVDVTALGRAAVQLATSGTIVSGGSTLTMQVARLIDGHATRGLSAKLRQILAALALERRHDKAAILTRYLNRAPFGGNLEGVRTAALAWFGKEPLRLSTAEAALLVALPQAPEARRPDRDPHAARRARDRVLGRAFAVGLIDRTELDRARAEPVPDARRPMPMLAAHAAEATRAGAPDRAEHRLTIDATLQARLEGLARGAAGRMGDEVSVAIMLADHKNGDVLASVGSADYFDAARAGYVDMTRAVRSPGSTLKPMIYALAFQEGLAHPESLIEDRPTAFSGYRPANFDRDYQGTVTVRRALQQSLNVPAVQMLDAVGPARLMAALRRAGAAPVIPDDAPPNLAIGLGGVGMSLADLVAAQATIAAGGRSVPLRIDASVPPVRPRQVLDPRAAWLTASIMAGARDPGGLAPATIAFKTGTSYGYRDAWAIGFDGRHVAGVWVGRPDGRPVPGLVGIEAAAPVLMEVFARLGTTTPLPPAPPGTLIARTAELPAPLRHVGARSEADAGLAGGPEIAFPPDGSRLELGLDAADRPPLPPVVLKVRDGALPLTVLVNGAPIPAGRYRREVEWRPAGAGAADIMVIDAEGLVARSTVFVQ